MEEKNKSVISTGLAVLLIALVGVNVYRTEMLRKEVLALSEKFGPTEMQQAAPQEAKGESAGVAAQAPAVSAPKPAPQQAKPASAKPRNGRVSVAAKVRVENRYVRGRTYLPNVSVGPMGTVVINVVMDQLGRVSSVSVGRGSTISDEDVLDACKEAALKTEFSLNLDAPRKASGTITYTFSASRF